MEVTKWLKPSGTYYAQRYYGRDQTARIVEGRRR